MRLTDDMISFVDTDKITALAKTLEITQAMSKEYNLPMQSSCDVMCATEDFFIPVRSWCLRFVV